MKMVALIVALIGSVCVAQTRPSDGQADLLAGDYKGAIEAFEAELAEMPKGPPKEPEHVNTLHGLAIAYARTGEIAKGRTLLERARAGKFTNRTLEYNCAVIDAQAKGSMIRAANTIAGILADGEVDENLLNVMGNCIDGAGRKNKALLAKYEAIESRLEATRPGQRRFGSRWIDAASYDETVKPSAITNQIAKEETNGRNAEREMQDAKRRIKELNAEIIAARESYRKEQLQRDIQFQQQRYATAERNVKAALKRIEQLEESYPKPSWTCAYETVLPDWDLKTE